MKQEDDSIKEIDSEKEQVIFDRKVYDQEWKQQKEENRKHNANLFQGLRNGHYYIDGKRMKKEKDRLAKIRKELEKYM